MAGNPQRSLVVPSSSGNYQLYNVNQINRSRSLLRSHHHSRYATSNFVPYRLFMTFPVNAVPLRVVGPAEGSPEAKERVKTATSDGKHVLSSQIH